MGKPGRISAGPGADYTSQEAAAPPGRVSIHRPLRGRLTQPARRARPIPSPGAWGWTPRRSLPLPNDAPPVAGATRVYHCPEEEERRGSCPSLQNHCPGAAPARAPSGCDLPGERGDPRARPAQPATPPLGAPFAAAIGQRALIQTTARSVHLVYFRYSWVIG